MNAQIPYKTAINVIFHLSNVRASVSISIHLYPVMYSLLISTVSKKKVGTHESALIIPEHTKKIRKYEVLIGHLIIWHICLNLLTAIAVTIIKEWPKITLTEKKKFANQRTRECYMPCKFQHVKSCTY